MCQDLIDPQRAPRRFGALGLIAAFAAAANAQPSFTPLGFLDPDGFGPCIAYAVTPDGSVVVGESNSPQGFQAFRWTREGGMVGLGDIPGGFFSSAAYAVSDDGNMIVGQSDDGSAGEGGTAIIWTPKDGMQLLGNLGGPTTYGQGWAISGDGSVVAGTSQSPLGLEAFIWTAETGMESIGDLPGGVLSSGASGISADGAVIIGTGASDTLGAEAFRWTADGGMVGLEGFPLSFGLAVSRDGNTIVGEEEGRPAYWTTETGWVNLGFLIFQQSIGWANAVSEDGSVIGGITDFNATEGTGEAFIWDADNGMRSLTQVLLGLGLDLDFFRIYQVYGMSADGQIIVGYGFNKFGEQEGFIADLREGTCAADCNSDGSINIFDFLCFQGLVTEGDSAADCNADSAINIFDFLCFQGLVTIGCP